MQEDIDFMCNSKTEKCSLPSDIIAYRLKQQQCHMEVKEELSSDFSSSEDQIDDYPLKKKSRRQKKRRRPPKTEEQKIKEAANSKAYRERLKTLKEQGLEVPIRKPTPSELTPEHKIRKAANSKAYRERRKRLMEEGVLPPAERMPKTDERRRREAGYSRAYRERKKAFGEVSFSLALTQSHSIQEALMLQSQSLQQYENETRMSGQNENEQSPLNILVNCMDTQSDHYTDMDQPIPIINHPAPTLSQPIPISTQPIPSISQPILTQPIHILGQLPTTQPIPIISKPDLTQPIPITALPIAGKCQPIPILSQSMSPNQPMVPIPIKSQQIPIKIQQIPIKSQQIPIISQPIPIRTERTQQSYKLNRMDTERDEDLIEIEMEQQHSDGDDGQLLQQLNQKDITHQDSRPSDGVKLDIKLPSDMKNYMEYHVMGQVSAVRMKPDCLPSKFECQEAKRQRRCTRADPLNSQVDSDESTDNDQSEDDQPLVTIQETTLEAASKNKLKIATKPPLLSTTVKLETLTENEGYHIKEEPIEFEIPVTATDIDTAIKVIRAANLDIRIGVDTYSVVQALEDMKTDIS